MELQFLYSFCLALILSLVLIPILIKISSTLRLVDNPEGNERKLHSAPIPRSGGLAIILSAAIALLLVLPNDESLNSFLLSCLVIVGFGLLDDLVELKPISKLGGQALGVGLAMAGGMVISDVPFFVDAPSWFCYALTFVFVMGVINGVNFSDGMDGLAAGTTLMAMVVIFVVALEFNNTQVAAVALAICAALVGFLRFNTHPAVIFMGDAGSQFLGFTVAWLSITVSQEASSSITTLLPLLILGIPVMDILQVVPVRIKKKLPLPGPDKEHFHHQIAKLGFYQAEVVATIYILQFVLLSGAYQLRFAADYLVFGFYALFAAIVLGTIYMANVTSWKIRPEESVRVVERRNLFLRRFGRFHPYSGKFYGITISLLLILASLSATKMSPGLIYIALAWAFFLLLLELLSRKRWPVVLGRLTSYTATVFCVFGMTLSIQSELLSLSINYFLAGLTVLLAISVLTTRKEYFWFTPQDLLVLFFIVLLAPQLPLEFGQDINIGELIFRTFVLLYACEYVLARGDQARTRLTYASLLSLFLLGIHILA